MMCTDIEYSFMTKQQQGDIGSKTQGPAILEFKMKTLHSPDGPLLPNTTQIALSFIHICCSMNYTRQHPKVVWDGIGGFDDFSTFNSDKAEWIGPEATQLWVFPPTRYVNTVATVYCKTICQYWYYTHTYCQWQFATVSTQYVNVVAAVFETLPGTTYLKALPPQKEQNSCSIFTKCQKHPNGYYDGISRNISVFKEQIKMHATLKQPNCSRWKQRKHLKNCYHHWEGELAETLWEFRQFFPREIMGENCSVKAWKSLGDQEISWKILTSAGQEKEKEEKKTLQLWIFLEGLQKKERKPNRSRGLSIRDSFF